MNIYIIKKCYEFNKILINNFFKFITINENINSNSDNINDNM